jgi:uncharacterized protein YecE (DUF72 family)
LNNSFYRQPKDVTWEHWHDSAPPGFRYAVKANRYITHMKRFIDCEQPLKRFFDGAGRLKSFLGPVLYQTPPSFACNPDNLDRLDGFMGLLPGGVRHVFEFRHVSWFGLEGLALLERHGVGFCVQDMPGLRCPVAVTSPVAYFRFHGVGKAYHGAYSDAALGRWADEMLRLNGVDEVWAFFNNDADGHAPANALSLAGLLHTGEPAYQ